MILGTAMSTIRTTPKSVGDPGIRVVGSGDVADHGQIIHIKAQLQGLADSVLEGSVTRADAAVAGQVLNYLLGAIKIELQIREQTEHDQRISLLEEKARQRELVKHGNGQF
jgi:hypothetical protein